MFNIQNFQYFEKAQMLTRQIQPTQKAARLICNVRHQNYENIDYIHYLAGEFQICPDDD
jgi:hypothetical protein